VDSAPLFVRTGFFHSGTGKPGLLIGMPASNAGPVPSTARLGLLRFAPELDVRLFLSTSGLKGVRKGTVATDVAEKYSAAIVISPGRDFSGHFYLRE
jgi:hypothetical protein